MHDTQVGDPKTGDVVPLITQWAATTTLFADSATAIVDAGFFTNPAFSALAKTKENDRVKEYYVKVAKYTELIVLGETAAQGPTLTDWEACAGRFVQTNPHPNPNSKLAKLASSPAAFLSFAGGQYTHCGAR